MGTMLNIKNFFKGSKAVKGANKSLNRRTAEEQLKLAKARNKIAHMYGGANDRDLRAIFIPKRTKLKGYQKENKR